MTTLEMPIAAGELLTKTAYVAAAVVAALVVQRIVVKASKRLFVVAGAPKVSIIINILRVLIWACALMCILEPVFGITPTYFVATLGVVSVAISLGLQDTISNVFSGLVLMAGHVIRPGDDISVGGVSGRVTDVTWRSTSVQDRYGSVEIIPNSVLNKTSLKRLHPSQVGKAVVPIAVVPNADLDEVTHQIVDLAVEVAGDLLNPDYPPRVLILGMDEYGTRASIVLCAASGVPTDIPVDKVLRAVQGKPWVASALPNDIRS